MFAVIWDGILGSTKLRATQEAVFFGLVAGVLMPWAATSQATTIQADTRPEIVRTAGLWEVDSVRIASLADSQYPQFFIGFKRLVGSLTNTPS